jgi:hypothetical protein
MPSPPGFIASPYVGLLVLDQQNPWSFLTTKLCSGSAIQALLQRDPAATGEQSLGPVRDVSVTENFRHRLSALALLKAACLGKPIRSP